MIDASYGTTRRSFEHENFFPETMEGSRRRQRRRARPLHVTLKHKYRVKLVESMFEGLECTDGSNGRANGGFAELAGWRRTKDVGSVRDVGLSSSCPNGCPSEGPSEGSLDGPADGRSLLAAKPSIRNPERSY